MFIWKREYDRTQANFRDLPREATRCLIAEGEVVFKRHACEWLLPLRTAKHIKYNPRHLPVVQVPVTNEDHYLRMAIRRYLKGWRAWTPVELLPKIQWR